jgi:DNA-binding IclR family transcriptional regulator
MPLQCTAVGKAILAHSGPALLDESIAGGLPALTAWSITDPETFRNEVRKTARRGYAIDDRENEPEVRCVAAPIFDHDDQVVGALSVSALKARMTVARVRELGPHVARVGLEISQEMGSPRARRILHATSTTTEGTPS